MTTLSSSTIVEGAGSFLLPVPRPPASRVDRDAGPPGHDHGRFYLPRVTTLAQASPPVRPRLGHSRFLLGPRTSQALSEVGERAEAQLRGPGSGRSLSVSALLGFPAGPARSLLASRALDPAAAPCRYRLFPLSGPAMGRSAWARQGRSSFPVQAHLQAGPRPWPDPPPVDSPVYLLDHPAA